MTPTIRADGGTNNGKYLKSDLTWQATAQQAVVRRGGTSDEAVFTWTVDSPETAVIPFKIVVVTVTHASGAIGSAIHDVAIGWQVYLPLVVRDWYSLDLWLP